jgi:sulfite exporter TauE/SafE
MRDFEEKRLQKVFNIIMIAVIAILIAYLLKQTTGFKQYLPALSTGAGLGLVFVFGLVTSLHCVGMCGGFVLTQSVQSTENGEKKSRREIVRPPILFNLGRIVSYTAIGGIVGGIGQVLSLADFVKGLIPMVGGVFMILMALNVLGAFPFMRRMQFGAPKGVVKKIRNGETGPFILGLLMGIMPCGPLQMAQIYALTTGSALWGALAMFVFSVGTVPCLLILGCFGSFMTKRFARTVLQCSAVVIIALGISMVGKGLAMNGIHNPLSPIMSTPSSSSMSGGPASGTAMPEVLDNASPSGMNGANR